MNKAKSFLVFILLFGIFFGFPISKTSAASPSLRLTSTPAGAAIYKNGSSTYHVTPYTIPGLTAGTTYTFTLKKTGYVTKTASFKAVTGSTALTLPLSATPSLNLTSSPSGATVYVNGVKQASLTPCTFNAAVAGTRYALTFSKAGYLPFSQTFAAQTEGTSNISAKLLLLPASPSIASPFVKKYNIVIPAIQYASTTAPESKTFVWSYNEITYTWQVAAPASLLSLVRAQAAYVGTIYVPPYTAPQQNTLGISPSLLQAMLQECYAGPLFANFSAWTQEPTNVAYIGQLARTLATVAKTAGYDYFHTAEFLLAFVDTAIPYKVTITPQLPVLTLFDNGMCADKSILYASLLEALGYKVAFFLLPTVPGFGSATHEVVGVAFTSQQVTSAYALTPIYCSQNGYNYYYAETTSQSYLLGERSFSGTLIVYPLN